ncbi:outer membrane efflux protein [Thalassoporum mexicanum PCC 7367]|uniref:TolC family protein n=1 Tax=Thalassoporum mexicanum TaxID=3457544 RepID=UPI00029FA1DE|nr:TolC family protein [Pseudanabaena sp. PCC 7367]AFY69706.1 outer membrane efflux protein [Pseudanabaena sp. PCC 7367]
MRISPNWIVWGAFISVLTTTIAASAQTTEIDPKTRDGDRHASVVSQPIDPIDNSVTVAEVSGLEPEQIEPEMPAPTQAALSRDIDRAEHENGPAAVELALSWLSNNDQSQSSEQVASGLVGIKASDAVGVEVVAAEVVAKESRDLEPSSSLDAQSQLNSVNPAVTQTEPEQSDSLDANSKYSEDSEHSEDAIVRLELAEPIELAETAQTVDSPEPTIVLVEDSAVEFADRILPTRSQDGQEKQSELTELAAVDGSIELETIEAEHNSTDTDTDNGNGLINELTEVIDSPAIEIEQPDALQLEPDNASAPQSIAEITETIEHSEVADLAIAPVEQTNEPEVNGNQLDPELVNNPAEVEAELVAVADPDTQSIEAIDAVPDQIADSEELSDTTVTPVTPLAQVEKVATIGDLEADAVAVESKSEVELDSAPVAASQNLEHKLSGELESDQNQNKDKTEAIAQPDPIAETEVIASIATAKPLIVPTSPTQVQIEKVQEITLTEAIEIAIQNSETITQARISVEQSRAVLEEALAAFKPTVDAQVDYTINDSARIRASNVASAFGVQLSQETVSHDLNGTIGVNYNVFTSGRRSANVRVAENQLRIVEADLDRTVQAVILDAVTAYYNVQSADEQVRIQQKSVENNQRSLQDTSALERAGVGTKFDVLQAEVQLANAQQDLLDAEANQRITRRELARQLNLSDTVDLAAADPIQPAPDWGKSIEESILMALRNRSELDIRKLQREVARDQARAELANLGPQVRVFANYDLFDDLTATGGVAMGYRFGAVVTMNLFDGGVARARAKQRAADEALAESRFDQDSDQIRFDVEQAYINLESRREQISTSSLAVESATEALRLARLRLSAGVDTQLQVIRAEDDLVRAEVNQLLAVIGFNQSLANLQRAINGL